MSFGKARAGPGTNGSSKSGLTVLIIQFKALPLAGGGGVLIHTSNFTFRFVVTASIDALTK
ncbi:hypothetical protein FEDK69T_31220 [Flavobacterium enshiense DK69]|nr:hypothetical protein FEDK69T_31220 [Flavobacterium enshiense DK69]